MELLSGARGEREPLLKPTTGNSIEELFRLLLRYSSYPTQIRFHVKASCTDRFKTFDGGLKINAKKKKSSGCCCREIFTHPIFGTREHNLTQFDQVIGPKS